MSFIRSLFRGETRFDFLGRRKLWFAISAILLAVSVGSLIFKGLTYGIEFEGGVQITAPLPADGPLGDASSNEVVDSISREVAPLGATDAQVQVTGSGDERGVLLQTKEVADPEAQARLVTAVSEAAGATPAQTDSSRVGRTWGGEITSKAVRALIIFLVVVVLFISWRFEWKMAVGAFVALVHDLLITAGIYSLVGFEVTPSSVIAILTILGYSLYDTVVVFDKVEEDTKALAATGRTTYQDAANLAMNEVFMRSLNTTLATLIPVSTLLFVGAGLLGASTLKDLALALFVGLLIGAYSSIFVATPVLAMLKEREPRYRNMREKVLRDARRHALPAKGSSEEEQSEPVGVAAGTAGGSAVASSRPRPAARPSGQTARPRAGARKAKRRKRR